MAPITDISQLDLDRHYTYADYWAWRFPEHVELLRGQVIPRQTPFTIHQQCLGHLAAQVLTYCRKTTC